MLAANGWHSSGVAQNSSCWRKFQWIFDVKGNLVRVSGVKLTEKWGEIQGKWDLVRVSGEFELSRLLFSVWCTVYDVTKSQIKTVHVSQLWGKARYVYHKWSTLLLVVDGSWALTVELSSCIGACVMQRIPKPLQDWEQVASCRRQTPSQDHYRRWRPEKPTSSQWRRSLRRRIIIWKDMNPLTEPAVGDIIVETLSLNGGTSENKTIYTPRLLRSKGLRCFLQEARTAA